jgi:hypothetical protein
MPRAGLKNDCLAHPFDRQSAKGKGHRSYSGGFFLVWCDVGVSRSTQSFAVATGPAHLLGKQYGILKSLSSVDCRKRCPPNDGLKLGTLTGASWTSPSRRRRLRHLPFVKRKAALRRLLKADRGGIQYVEHAEGHGDIRRHPSRPFIVFNFSFMSALASASLALAIRWSCCSAVIRVLRGTA